MTSVRCRFGVGLAVLGVVGLGLVTAQVNASAQPTGPLEFSATYHVPGSAPRPFAVMIASKSHTAYIADADEQSMSVLRIGAARVHTVSEPAMGTSIDGTSVDSATGDAYVAVDQTSTVDVYRGTKHLMTLTLPEFNSGARQAIFDPNNQLLYVTDEFLDAVHVFRGSTEVAIIPLHGKLGYGDGPGYAALNPTTGDLYVPCDDGNLYVISGTSLLAPIPTGVSGSMVAIDTVHQTAYTIDPYYDRAAVTALGTGTSSTTSLDGSPTAVSVDPNPGLAYISTSTGSAVILHGSAVAGTVPETEQPSANEPLAVDPTHDLALVPNGHTLQVLHDASVVQSLPLPSATDENAVAAFDLTTGSAVLTQQGAETVSVLTRTD